MSERAEEPSAGALRSAARALGKDLRLSERGELRHPLDEHPESVQDRRRAHFRNRSKHLRLAIAALERWHAARDTEIGGG